MSQKMTVRLPSYDTTGFAGPGARLTTYYISAIKPDNGRATLECRPLVLVFAPVCPLEVRDILLQPPNRMTDSSISPSQPAGLSRALDNFLTRHRIGVWRVVVTFVLASLVFGHSRWDGTWGSPLLLTLGMLGVSLATVGRLWCALYISGRKNNTLVTSGPYSLCRHPLYVCNLLGIIGLGAMTESLAVTAVLALAFALMYPAVIRTEDRFLASAFPEFAEYARRTPAFFPRLSLYRGESTWTVHVSSFQRNIADSVWFLGLSVVVESFDLFHDAGVLRAVVTLA